MRFKLGDRIEGNYQANGLSSIVQRKGVVVKLNRPLYSVKWNGSSQPQPYSVPYLEKRYSLDRKYYRDKFLTDLLFP